MKKKILEFIERLIGKLLSCFSCLGMFALLNFLVNLFWEQELQTGELFGLFAASVVLTYFLTNGYMYVRYKRLEILADELEQERDEQPGKLYEHLRVK